MPAEGIDEELRLLDHKLATLKRDYDQYFLGARPREPVVLRAEVNKTIVRLTNSTFKNTAARFRFSSLCSRFQAHRRQWDDILRRIEEGTYERHRFRAKLHGPGANPARRGDSGPSGGSAEDDLFQTYVDARLACGEKVEGLSREKLDQVLEKQRAQLRRRFGEDADFRFRVAVENGKVRLKAARKDS